MGKGRKRHRRKRKNWKRKGDRGRGSSEVSLKPLELEIDKSYDGFLRGAVEPVMLAGLYVVTPSSASLVLRTHHLLRAPQKGGPQSMVLPDVQAEKRRYTLPNPGEAVLLVAMLEEDAGQCWKAVYADLEQVERISVFRSGIDAVPVLLDEVITSALEPGQVHDVEVIGNSGAWADVSTDKWIGAGLWRWPIDPQASAFSRTVRVPVADESGRNVWAAMFDLRWRRR